jgi:predicted site-specific integrase-resolvase
MSQAEVADALGVNPSTLAEWHRCGWGPLAVATGATLQYRPSDVADWLRDQIRAVNGVCEVRPGPHRSASGRRR